MHASPDDSTTGSSEVQETFGRYQLLGLLGQGGMGRLYIAERRGIQGFVKIVALKRILPHLADSASCARCSSTKRGSPRGSSTRTSSRPTSWARSTAITSSAWSTCPARICRRSSPAARARRPCRSRSPPRWPSRRRKGCTTRTRRATGRASSIGLVHRDVNPRNIFVTYHGVVKLLDFGVVADPRGRRACPACSRASTAIAPPNSSRAGRSIAAPTSSAWGSSLWECLTGARLFDARTDAATIDAVRSRPIEPPERAAPRRAAGARRDRAARARARSRRSASRARTTCPRSSIASCSSARRRPTSKSVGRWMESIFGAERAALKKAISQGENVEATLQRLKSLEEPPSRHPAAQPRALWSTSFETAESAAATQGRSAPSLDGSASRPLAEESRVSRTDPGELLSTRRVSVLPHPQAAGAVPASPAVRRSRRPVLSALVALAGLTAIGAVVLSGVARRPGAVEDASPAATATLQLRSVPRVRRSSSTAPPRDCGRRRP